MDAKHAQSGHWQSESVELAFYNHIKIFIIWCWCTKPASEVHSLANSERWSMDDHSTVITTDIFYFNNNATEGVTVLSIPVVDRRTSSPKMTLFKSPFDSSFWLLLSSLAICFVWDTSDFILLISHSKLLIQKRRITSTWIQHKSAKFIYKFSCYLGKSM